MNEAQLATELLRWTLELTLDALLFALERRYAPDQPRVPAGNSDGGQWTIVSGRSGSRQLAMDLTTMGSLHSQF